MAAEGVEVIQRMAERMTAHDLDGMVELVHEDYQSEQPFHPARGFSGRAQMKANWRALLTGVPDMRGEVVASVQAGDVVWSEWHWVGTTEQGEPFDMRGVTQFTVRDGLVVRGRLFTELVEQGGADINDSVKTSSGHRPQLED
ncbi:MAG: nuclear transport factor 2 family protein [Pedococcus sp.]